VGGRGFVKLAVGALLLVFIVAPGLLGFVTARAYEQILSEVRATASSGYEIEGQFDRGWWTSRAETRIRFVADPSGGFEIPLQHHIVHGPVPLAMLASGGSPLGFLFAVVGTEYHAERERVPNIAEALGDRALIELTTRLGFDRSLKFHFRSPAFETADESVVSGGIEGDARITTGEAPWLSAEISSGAMTLRSPTSELRMEPSELGYSGAAIPQAMAEGELEAALGDIYVGTRGKAEASVLLLRGARLDQWTRKTAKSDAGEPEPGAVTETKATPLRSSTMHLRFSELSFGGNRYGPGRLESKLENIDVDSWVAMSEAMDELAGRGLPAEELEQARMMLTMEMLPKVLGASPTLTLEKLTLEGRSGTFSLTGLLGVDGSDPSALANPFMLLGQIRAEAKMAAPVPMLHSFLDRLMARDLAATGMLPPDQQAAVAKVARAELIAKLLQDGTLVLDGETYRLDAHLQEGLPILNGQPADPSFLMGILPGF